MSEDILLARDGALAIVTLNRPQSRNAITVAMWRTLVECARELDADASVRAVIFRGAAREAFSSGADISEFETQRNNSTQARDYSTAFEGALDAVAAIGKPTFSMIWGVCVGGGLELATATDLRFASTDARFGVPIARLGILVGYKEMRRLVQIVGAAAAMDLLLTARLVDSATALRLGLVNDVRPADELESFVFDLARRVAELAPASHRAHKQILNIVLANPALRDLADGAAALPYAIFDTRDFQEGRRAFLQKRAPRFVGE